MTTQEFKQHSANRIKKDLELKFKERQRQLIVKISRHLSKGLK